MKRTGGSAPARWHISVPRGQHPAEIQNRQTKVWKLVAALRNVGVTADDAAHMTDSAWTAAARAADVSEPSPATRRWVVQMLARSSSPVARDPAEHL